MDIRESSRTAELIREARDTCRKTRELLDDLDRGEIEVDEAADLVKWWSFFDFDPKVADFLSKLDMKTPRDL